MLKRLAAARLFLGRGIRPASSIALKPPQKTTWIHHDQRLAKLQECADLVDAKKFAASREILADMGNAPAAKNNTAIVSALIESALQSRLYQLAALFYLRFHEAYAIPIRQLDALVDGLTRYDPTLTPVHIKILGKLYCRLGGQLRMNSFQKLRLLEASLAGQKRDGRQVFAAFDLAQNIKGDKIPDIAINPLIRFFAAKEDLGKIVQIWKYLCSEYPDTYLSHTDVVLPLLILFLRKRRFRWLSLQIAESCLARAKTDPQYAFGVAEAARVTNDLDLADRLRHVLDDDLARPVVGQLMCLYASKGDHKKMGDMVSRMENGRFTAIELGSLVKHYLQVEPAQAFEILAKFSGANKYKVVAYVSICEHAVAVKDWALFKKYTHLMTKHATFNAHGLTTNLQIKWDSCHGDFATAKRNYQNRSLADQIDAKQRKIALNALMDLSIKEGASQDQLEWLKAEHKRVHIPLSYFHNRLKRRTAGE